MKHQRTSRAPIVLVALLLLSCALALPAVARAESEDPTTDEVAASAEAPEATADNEGTDVEEYRSTLEIQYLDDIVGKEIGVLTGSVFDQILISAYPEISQKDISYYNTNAELVGALKAGKTDVFVTDLPIAELASSTNDGIGIIPEPIMDDSYGFVLAKDSPYTAQINERLLAYHADGTIEALSEKWMGAYEDTKTMPAQDWPTPNGTWRIVTSPDMAPMSYLAGKELRGMCIEIIDMAARDLGYGVDFSYTTGGSLISEIQADKADIAASCFSITDERKQMVDMTEPFYDGGIVAVVRAESEDASDGTFLGNLAASFKRTFITEGRWKLIVSGLAVTLLISVASGALGCALGFAFVLLRRKREAGIADRLVHLLENLLGGLPVAVVLMVFYYVIFGSTSIDGIIVAIVVFTLIFGASSGSIMWNAIRAVDAGQTEAGRALGFSDRDTFFLVVLPQAARQFVPLLIGQFVGLVKDTSVVGFIAVQDLTRAGDLIRSRTMEAFFPLIAVAVIYFVVCRLLAWGLGKAAMRLEPKEGPRTIKGVRLS